MRFEILEGRLLLSNASDALASYVAAIFHDLLGRDVDAASQAYWVGRLEQGEAIGDMAANVVHSREYLVDRIDAAYMQILGRPADQSGLDYWLQHTDEQAEIGLLASDEFYARVGRSDQAFANAVYQILLGRPVENAGLRYWLGELQAGVSRSTVADRVPQSREGLERLVGDDYQQVFGRPADQAGFAYWTDRLAGGMSNDEALTEFVSTADYFKQQTGLPLTVVPTAGPWSWWQSFNDKINARVRQGNVDLMFVGDSITADWGAAGFGANAWAKYYSGLNAMEAGIPGDETQTALWRLEHGNLDDLHPKLVVVMLGTNDVYAGDSPDDIAAGVRAVVDSLHSQLPESKILVMGILPIGQAASNPLRQVITAANALISGAADGSSVFYLDIGTAYLDANGTFLPGVVQPDYTHLTEEGYGIWASAIEPMVDAVLG
ncbi:MAG TPA: DUF4214 domain-containing protein, partial [Pirellulales bacterium]|nr:DUF4214 domain-containing protein [Pirellulales bacterium]